MRRVNARTANSCFWILLLHLSPSFTSRITLDASGSNGREPMEVDMNANLTFATGGFLHRTRFVLVNDRVPRTDGHCALCGKIIEQGYVRDSRTRLIYCDTQCLPGRAVMAMPAIKDRARKVS
jgi:hypothetical protein